MSNTCAISMLTKDNADSGSEKSREYATMSARAVDPRAHYPVSHPRVLCVVFPLKIGTKGRFDARNVPPHASPVSVACGLEMPLLEILRWLLYF